MQVLRFGKEATFLRIGVVDPFVRWNGARKLKPVDLVPLVARWHYGNGPAGFQPWGYLHSHILHVGALVQDRHRIFIGEGLAVTFFGRECASKSEIIAKNE